MAVKYLEDIHKFTYSGKGPHSFIYFITINPLKNSQHLSRVKIGISKAPQKRLASMQTGSAYTLNLWYTIKVNEDMAKRLESSLHEKFRWSRYNGEWFTIHKAIRNFVTEHKHFAAA